MENKRPLAIYRGKLDPNQVAAGMNAAIKNAGQLLADAQLLFDAKSYGTACSLAALSIEESGKLACLRGIAVARDGKALKDGWRSYRDHKSKNAMWIMPDLVRKGARALDDLASIFAKGSDHPAVLDTVKQLGFYTDCCGEGHWSEPSTVIDEALAQQIIAVARLLLPRKVITVREIELWVEHVGPSLGGDMDLETMREGSLAFYAALAREGLTDVTTEQLEAFYRGRRVQ